MAFMTQNHEEEWAKETTNINCNLYYLANSTTKQRLHIGKKVCNPHYQQYNYFEIEKLCKWGED
jgi:hypothetical protein